MFDSTQTAIAAFSLHFPLCKSSRASGNIALDPTYCFMVLDKMSFRLAAELDGILVYPMAWMTAFSLHITSMDVFILKPLLM